jgi:hypothetical protein
MLRTSGFALPGQRFKHAKYSQTSADIISGTICSKFPRYLIDRSAWWISLLPAIILIIALIGGIGEIEQSKTG